MLYVKIGDLPKQIWAPATFFNYEYDEEWFKDGLVKEIIRSVDKNEILEDCVFRSKFLGIIGPERLSGGVKTLILAYKTNYTIDATFMGDNCIKWLFKIAEKKDLRVGLHHPPDFGDSFKFICLNNNKLITNMKEFFEVYKEYADEIKYNPEMYLSEEEYNEL